MVQTQEVRNNGLLGFFLAVLMLLIDLFVPSISYTGMNYFHPTSYYFNWLRVTIGFIGPLILGVIAFLLLTKKGLTKQKITLIVVFSILFVFILAYGGIPHTFVHLIFPILILITYPKDFMSDEEILKWLIVLYIFDFFINGILTSGSILSRWVLPFSFPFWLLFTTVLGWRLSGGSGVAGAIYILLLFFIILLLVFYYIQSIQFLNNAEGNVDEFKKGLSYFLSQSLSKMGDTLNEITYGFIQAFNTSQYTYTGQEEVSEDPQGVFLEQLERGEIIYKEDSPAYVWARLKAKTLAKGQKFTVTVTCKTEIEDEYGDKEEVYGIVNEKTKAKELELDVFTGVERTIPCYFDSLPEGSYDIIYNATFDFETDAKKKIYLMDRNRMINDFELLADKGLNPSKELLMSELYDIQESDPDATYTTGPISVGIGTDQPPWDIGEVNNIRPLFGVTIENKWSNGGRIDKLKIIYLKVPDSLLINGGTCSGYPIHKTNEEIEQGFNVYKLEPDISDVEESVSVNCLMDIDKNPLDPVPVTTRFLKAHVTYSYSLQEEISIEVEGYGLDEDTDTSDVVGRQDNVCCKITQSTTNPSTGDTISRISYEMMNALSCTSSNTQGGLHQQVESWMCGSKLCCRVIYSGGGEYHWVQNEAECDRYDSTYSSGTITDNSQCSGV